MCAHYIYTTQLRHHRERTLEEVPTQFSGFTLLVIPTVAIGSSRHGKIFAQAAESSRFSIPVPKKTHNR